jgi:anthranilate synthase component 1
MPADGVHAMTGARRLAPGLDLLALQRRDPRRFPLLLESVAGGNAREHWDLLLAGNGEGLELGADGITRRLDGAPVAGDFLPALDADWQRARVMPPTAGTAGAAGAAGTAAGGDAGLPFRGGWALFLAYELAEQVEPVLRLPRAEGPLPVALALRCPGALLRERNSGACLVVCEPGHDEVLAAMLAAAAAASAAAPAAPPDAWSPPVAIEEDAPAAFLDGVARVHAYLRAGDVFQVNLSRGWRARFASPPDPSAFYARLRDANPAPFAGLLRRGDWALASSSPERLVSVRGDVVETRPIAGTRPRLPGDDEGARIRELEAHPKERAEHVMLIDLERNDLGRVCVPGSVRVDEMMRIESYAHVHHIVSNVRGTLRAGATPGEVIAAVFPGGTITGCPKVRCMQVIAELEGAGRGAYTGALGYLGVDGDMDLNILIRSAWLAGDEARLRAGAGLVVDSVAASELEETRAKARGLLRALGVPAGAEP